MADFHQNTAHEELVKHALEKTTETGITEANKEQLKKALEEKAIDGKLKIKIETQDELNTLKTNIVTSLNLKKAAGLTEIEIQETAKEIITKSEKPATTPETASTAAAAPEAPPAIPEESIDLLNGETLQQIPESYQKEVKNHIVNNGGFAGMVMKGISNWITEIIKGIKGFFGTFGIEDEGEKKDVLAQINGFEDAEEERRVTSSVKALKSSPITKGPPLSDILRISHISNEELTKILKDNPALDFSSTKNIEAAFTGKYKHSGDREPMKRYDRVFLKLKSIHNNMDPSEPYNATNKFKDILAGSQDSTLDSAIPVPEGVPPASATLAAASSGTIEAAPSSPEIQTELMTKATEVDEALTKAQAMPEGTPEERNRKTEAVKSAQETVSTFKEQRKNNILSKYTDIKDRIKEGEIERNTLIQRNSPEEPEKKKREEVDKNLIKLRAIESTIKTKMDEVIKPDSDKWVIKDGINAEKMASVEIAIIALENNYVAAETQTDSEKEKMEKEKKCTYALGKLWSKNDANNKYLLDPSRNIEYAKKVYGELLEDAEFNKETENFKKLEKQIKFSEGKREFLGSILRYLGGKVIDTDNTTLKTTGIDGNEDDGWVEIEDGKLEFDERGAFYDTPGLAIEQKYIELFGNIYEARNFIIDNKSSIINNNINEEVLLPSETI